MQKVFKENEENKARKEAEKEAARSRFSFPF